MFKKVFFPIGLFIVAFFGIAVFELTLIKFIAFIFICGYFAVIGYVSAILEFGVEETKSDDIDIMGGPGDDRFNRR